GPGLRRAVGHDLPRRARRARHDRRRRAHPGQRRAGPRHAAAAPAPPRSSVPGRGGDLLALALSGLAQLLEADDLPGRAPVALGDLADEHPDAQAGGVVEVGGLEYGLGELLDRALLAPLAQR